MQASSRRRKRIYLQMPAGNNLPRLRDCRSAFSHIQFIDNKIKYFMKGSVGYTRIKPIVWIIFCVVAKLTQSSIGQILDWDDFSCLTQGTFTPWDTKRREKWLLFMHHRAGKRLWNVILDAFHFDHQDAKLCANCERKLGPIGQCG